MSFESSKRMTSPAMYCNTTVTVGQQTFLTLTEQRTQSNVPRRYAEGKEE
jgi:hypothetical protein